MISDFAYSSFLYIFVNSTQVPIIKFMTYLVSHIYLMGLFCLTIVAPLVPIHESTSLVPHWYEWILLAWLSGLLVLDLTSPGERQGLGWIRTVNLAICAVSQDVFFYLVCSKLARNNKKKKKKKFKREHNMEGLIAT